jgi:hypothetical protein
MSGITFDDIDAIAAAVINAGTCACDVIAVQSPPGKVIAMYKHHQAPRPHLTGYAEVNLYAATAISSGQPSP